MKQTRWILVAILVLAAVFALAACDEGVTPPVDEACEHAYESTVTAEPTCTKEGTTTYTCSKCQDSYTEAIAATGKHTYTETVTAPTCTAEGYTTYTCACGDTYKGNTVAATGHTYTDTVVAPTCSAEGYTTHTCACGDTYKDTTVAATGEHTYTEKVTAPTCTAEGYTTYTCACGKSYKDNTVAATGHDYTEKVTEEATCSKEGKATYTCSKCNDSYTAAIAKKEHAYAAFTAHAPTCDTNGEEQTKCEVCGDVYHTKVLEATGHSYTSSVTAPTCLADGYTTYTCSVCGDSYQDDVIAASKDYHVFVPSIIALTDEEAEANPDAIAIATMVCKICGEADANAAKQAVLINLDFNTEPTTEEVNAYEGSEGYQNYKGREPGAAALAAAYLVDVQKHLDVITNNNSSNYLSSFGVSLVDGALKTGNYAMFANDLKLGRKDGTLKAFTVAFDMTINRGAPTVMFAIISNLSPSNNRPIILTTKDDGNGVRHLVIQSSVNGPNTLNVDTGYSLQIGEAYSYKLEMTGAPAYTVTLSIKKVSEETYTNLGTYVYSPDPKAAPEGEPEKAFTYFTFSNGSSSNPGALVDNILVTAPFDDTPCTEHNYVSTVKKDATCAEKGTRLYACLACGDSYTEEIEATGKHDYVPVVTAPTCTVDGYTTHTCSVCGDSYTDSTVAATGHSYTRTEIPANCVDGYFEYTCACGDKYTEPSGQLGTGEHDWAQTSTVPPTCGTAGYFVETCNNCGNTRNVDDPNSPATGLHTYQTAIRELTEAEAALNPDAIGVEGAYCTLCGAADPTVPEVAVLINVTFDGTEGKTAAEVFDEQQNMDAHTTSGLPNIANGGLVMTDAQFFVRDNLVTGYKTAKYQNVTITFDIELNRDASVVAESKGLVRFFTISNGGVWNRVPVVLALDRVDQDPGEGKKFELLVQSWSNGKTTNTITDFETGTLLELGKAYTFKLDLNGKNLALYYKEVGATDYTKVGDFTLTLFSNNGTYTYSVIGFAYSMTARDNIVDNYKMTTAFVAE